MKWFYKDLTEWIKNGCDKVVGDTITELNISGNKLTTLPKEIGNLINLQHFDCHLNNLTTLPQEIGKLNNLQHFVSEYLKPQVLVFHRHRMTTFEF